MRRPLAAVVDVKRGRLLLRVVLVGWPPTATLFRAGIDVNRGRNRRYTGQEFPLDRAGADVTPGRNRRYTGQENRRKSLLAKGFLSG